MTTFQAVIYAFFHGASEFLPISAQAHHILIAFLLGWQPPTGGLLAAFEVGSSVALFVYFRHDWASMISSLLQVIIYRKKPMTLDERIPLFIVVTSLPIVVSSFYFTHPIELMDWSPLRVALVLGATALPLWFMDYWSRKIKGLYDWNWGDAFLVGLAQATALFPGWDRLSALLLGAFLLNYKRETALKYAYFSIFPALVARAVVGLKEVDFHASVPMPELSWLSFFAAMIVACFVSLLVIGGSMKQIQQKGLGQYMLYRCLLAAAVSCFYWFRTYS
jgi:undecaprenyl-diphosphatase